MSTVQVEGVVSRLHKTGGGFGLKETSTAKDGREFVRYWAVFPKEPVTVAEGDAVEVSGFLDAKVGKPKTNRDGEEVRYVDLTVSRATVRTLARVEQDATPAPFEADGWGGSDESPF